MPELIPTLIELYVLPDDPRRGRTYRTALPAAPNKDHQMEFDGHSWTVMWVAWVVEGGAFKHLHVGVQ